MDAIKEALPECRDACPSGLRLVVEAWKAGWASNQELVEASYAEALNWLEDYRARPLPDAPAGVIQYRAMSERERRGWSASEHQEHHTTYRQFYESESQIRQENDSNRHWLNQVSAWAHGKGLPESVQAAIRAAQRTHPDEDAQA